MPLTQEARRPQLTKLSVSPHKAGQLDRVSNVPLGPSPMDLIRADEKRIVDDGRNAPVAGITQAPTGMQVGPQGFTGGASGLFQPMPFHSGGSSGGAAGGARPIDPITGMPQVMPGHIGNAPYTTQQGLTGDDVVSARGGLAMPTTMGSLNNPITQDNIRRAGVPNQVGNAIDQTISNAFGAINYRAAGGDLPEGVTIVGEKGPEATVKTPMGTFVIPNAKLPMFKQHAKELLDAQKGNLDQKTGHYNRGDHRGLTPAQLFQAVAMAYVPKGPEVQALANRGDWNGRKMDLIDTIENQMKSGKITPDQGQSMYANLGAGMTPEDVSKSGSAFVAQPMPAGNPYGGGNSGAPSPRGLDPRSRYLDLDNRLAALRSEAMVEGKAAAQNALAQYHSEMPSGATRSTGFEGQTISGKYGTGTISNQPMPKDFPIVLADGTVKHFNNIGDFAKEDAADQAQRHVEGMPLTETRGASVTQPMIAAIPKIQPRGTAAPSAATATPTAMPMPVDYASTSGAKQPALFPVDYGTPIPDDEAVAAKGQKAREQQDRDAASKAEFDALKAKQRDVEDKKFATEQAKKPYMTKGGGYNDGSNRM